MVSFIKPSAAANMKQYLMPSYGEIMKHALTCKAIGAEVCSSVWCEFVLVKVNMNQLGVILYLNMYVCKFEPIQHVFRQKAFCKESILFHSYTLFYSLQRGQGIFIAINYTHVFSGDPKVLLTNHRDTDPVEAAEIIRRLERRGYVVREMQFDVPRLNRDFNWAYINYLQVGKKVIVPTFGIPEDKQALKIIQEENPDCVVRGFRMRDIASKGGALHCITWNIKR